MELTQSMRSFIPSNFYRTTPVTCADAVVPKTRLATGRPKVDPAKIGAQELRVMEEALDININFWICFLEGAVSSCIERDQGTQISNCPNVPKQEIYLMQIYSGAPATSVSAREYA